MTKTPSEKLKESMTKYRRKCQSIVKISNNIRYAGVVNAYGKTLAGIIKHNVKPLMKSEIMKNELFIISTLMTLRKETTRVLGKLDYVLLQHQKISVLILQKNNVTYYITIDRKEKNRSNEIITSIKKII
ncbi:MAG: hypothetical protein OEM77_05050 [Nitrosopumilus sp.]|nr:hypothetical protein [Nitrosopumilus sp.]MDH3736775.1 hypothetical protein [Nitrosopumilus sp.]MDH3822426.1 hypothetical protein [Nitrosopumilus sp.]MDH3833794.1 hypothetical protein [Nitrosopumilus sp.]